MKHAGETKTQPCFCKIARKLAVSARLSLVARLRLSGCYVTWLLGYLVARLRDSVIFWLSGYLMVDVTTNEDIDNYSLLS